jgi:prevent-host-death family protein
MGPVNIKEARKRLSELVDAAERGDSVVITRRGKEVARLVPPEAAGRAEPPDLSDFRSSIKMKGKRLSRVVIDMRAEERY